MLVIMQTDTCSLTESPDLGMPYPRLTYYLISTNKTRVYKFLWKHYTFKLTLTVTTLALIIFMSMQ